MAKQSLFILGRQPILSCVELESLYKGFGKQRVGDVGMLINIDPEEVDFERLGGSVRLCEALNIIDNKSWSEIEKYLIQNVEKYLGNMPESKLNIGVSAFELSVDPKQIMSLELNIKRMAKQELGRSVRFIPNKDKALNSAQVIHNNLLDKNGLELIIVGEKTRAIVAKTIKIQNIADYSERDYGRPKRDPRVGMLPPKLAQIMVNLTAGNDNEVDKDNPPMILDPFCGTGVVLQEALLMGYKAYGTDIDERMVNYSRTNINEWLSNRIRRPFSAPATIEIGDATIYKWHQPFELVVSETYLGRALVSLPPEDKLIDIQRTCNTIIEKFLINLSKQVPSGFLACLALPAWRKPNGSLLRLPLIDRINDLGYNSVSFEYANNAPLIYSRETQIVAREILLLKRK